MSFSSAKYRKLESSGFLKKVMTQHYRRSKLPLLGKKVAWVTSGAPVEILRAMNILCLYPENYGAICGVQKIGSQLCSIAETHGFSQDLCSYAKSSIGSIINTKISPMKGLRRPHLLVCCNNICGTVLKWYQAVSQFYNIPLFLIDVPPFDATSDSHRIRYVESQLEDLITFLSDCTKQDLKENELKLVVEDANRAVILWMEILEACKATPSPLNCPDRFLAMAPIVTIRGTKRAINYYEMLLNETKGRISEGLGCYLNIEEKHRFLWDNIPIWHDMFDFFNRLAGQGIVFPADTYTQAWSGKIRHADPIKSMAIIYSSIYLNQTIEFKSDLMISLIKKYELNGFILHSDRSCKRYSVGQELIRHRIQDETGIPGLVIQGDHNDSRFYNKAKVESQINTYLHIVEG